MPLPILVPDASVILKWVLPSDGEPDSDRARQLLTAIVEERARALVPTLWLFEVGNTVARRFAPHAGQWLSALMKFGLEEVAPSERWLTVTLDLVSKYGSTFYDAAYHATALAHGGVFVTADAQYAARTKAESGVVGLADWRPPANTIRPRRG